jgi:outer membrane protein TolC
MSEMLSALKGDESEQLSTINSFLLRDTASPVITDSFPQVNYSDKTVSDLIHLAETNRPFLAGIKTAVEKAKLSESLAKYDYYPMFKLSAQYAFREQIKSTGMPLDNMVSVMLDVSIPLNYGGKVTSMVEETQSMQEMYQQQYSASLQMLEREFGMINAKLKSLKERIDLSEKGSLVQANENLKSALTAYQVGEIDFMNVLDAQSSLYTIEKNIYRLKTDYLNQLAQIEFLTGTKLNDQL